MSTYVVIVIKNNNDSTNNLIVSFLLFVRCFLDRKSIQDTCTYNSTVLAPVERSAYSTYFFSIFL